MSSIHLTQRIEYSILLENNINKEYYMTKAKSTRRIKTIKHIADTFGKDERIAAKKAVVYKFRSKIDDEPLFADADEGESLMDELPSEKEAEPATEVTPKTIYVRPITKRYDGIKQNVVVFSGGFDSTLILVDLLEKGFKPRLLTFQCEQFGENLHYISESAAQQKILEYLAKKYDYTPSRDYIRLEGDLIGWTGSEPALFQQPFMTSMVSIGGRNNACYHFGYHRGDDFWHSSHNILAAQEHLLAVAGQKNIMFSFPLQYLTKADIIRKLNYYHFPTDLCTFCYSPTYKGRCGRCVACQTYDKAIEEITRTSGAYKKMGADLYYPEGFIDSVPKNSSPWND